MAIPSHVVRQTDFSAGQISATAMRADNKQFMQSACRRLENWRLRGTGPAEVRPGRRALFLHAGRVDLVKIGASIEYKLCFGNGTLVVRDSNDTVLATDSGRPWSVSTVWQIVWTISDREIVITYPGMRPRVARLSGAGTWSFSDYAFSTDLSGQSRAPFFRFYETSGITMQPSDISVGASISVAFNGSVLTPAHVGSLFRYHGVQLLITGYTNAVVGSAVCIGYLPQSVRYAVDSSDGFAIGEIVEGSVTGTRGEVGGIPDGTHIDVIVLNNRAVGFTLQDIMIGPNARTQVGLSQAITPLATTVWDEQAISAARGWPQSCSTDSSRLIFCDLPTLPEGIIWSATADTTDLLVTSEATGAIFETIAGRPRVYHVVGGADEYVFTSRGVKYIPISENNPLKPGSITFRDIQAPPSSSVKPVATQDGLLYIDAARGRLVAIVATGQTTAPYIARDVSEFHAELFSSPFALATTTGDTSIPERYVYVLNDNGTLAVGRVDVQKEWIGWVPWLGDGYVNWISGLDAKLVLTSNYTQNNQPRSVVEQQDQSAYLDAQVTVNDVPTQLALGGGQGPLWWLASSQIHLMDGRRYLGTREVNASGFLVPEVDGETFDGANLIAGRNAVATLEPFIRHASEGQSVRQSQRRRKIKRFSITVQNSLGFLFGKRRIPPWVQGEDQAGQPPLREETYFFRVQGRAIDPSEPVFKDIPGPLRVVEIGYEVTV